MCAPTFVLSLMQTCHGQHDQGVSLRPCNDVVNLGAETLSFGFGKADLNPFCSQGSLQLDISTQEDFSVCVWGGGVEIRPQWKYLHFSLCKRNMFHLGIGSHFCLET